MPIEFNRFGNAAGRFKQIDLQLAGDVIPFARPPAAAPRPAKQIPKNTAPKDIAKRLENVVHIGELMHAPFHPRMAVSVVPRSLILIPQHFKRFGRLLEFDDGLLAVGIAIRMMLHRQLAIRVGNFFVRGTAPNAKNFVIIAFGLHRSHGDEQSAISSGGCPQPQTPLLNQIILRHAAKSVSAAWPPPPIT
jgi:hypothetical protein